jgi:DNA repair exonuclease SbcCD ATPase subunit
MQRELNPELFGERRLSTDAPAIVGDKVPEPDFLDVDRQILELKTQQQKMQTQLLDHVKGVNLKLERMQQLVSRLENSHNGLTQEIANRMSQMHGHIVERASVDEKTQEMIDRHNQMMKSFEARMTQLQRILQEKEAQLSHSLQALSEAKNEIARLKGF